MITVEQYLQYKQPDVCDGLSADRLTEFFEWIERIMQPVCDYLVENFQNI